MFREGAGKDLEGDKPTVEAGPDGLIKTVHPLSGESFPLR